MSLSYHLVIHAANVLAAPPPAVKPDLPSPSGGSLFLVSFFSFVIVFVVGAIVDQVRWYVETPKMTAKNIVTGSLVITAVSAILAAGVSGGYMTIMYISSMVG